MTSLYTPDALTAALQTAVLGRNLAWFETVGSTNDEARRLILEGARHGTVVVSRTQTAGRGRQGCTWASPPGGLWFSVILKPVPVSLTLLSLMCATATAQAIRSVGSREAWVKWPNDVLLLPEGKKVAGILLESRYVGEVTWAIAGIGVNASVTPEDLADLGDIAMTVSQEDIRLPLLASILLNLETALTSDRALETARTLSCTLGRRVRVDWESGSIRGVAVNLNAEGGLEIRTEASSVETVWSCLHCIHEGTP